LASLKSNIKNIELPRGLRIATECREVRKLNFWNEDWRWVERRKMKVKLEGMVLETIRGRGLENEKKERCKESYEEKPR